MSRFWGTMFRACFRVHDFRHQLVPEGYLARPKMEPYRWQPTRDIIFFFYYVTLIHLSSQCGQCSGNYGNCTAFGKLHHLSCLFTKSSWNYAKLIILLFYECHQFSFLPKNVSSYKSMTSLLSFYDWKGREMITQKKNKNISKVAISRSVDNPNWVILQIQRLKVINPYIAILTNY